MYSAILGIRLRFRVTFSSAPGEPKDPTGVTFKIVNPAGDMITSTYGVEPDIIRDTPGVYYIDVTPQLEGVTKWRWQGTGELEAACEGAVLMYTSLA